MKRNKGIKAPVQAGIVDFKGIFQDQIRTMVREGILSLIAQEVTELCGESHRPGGIYQRGGTEQVTIKTSSGKEPIAKRRVRMTLENGKKQEVVQAKQQVSSAKKAGGVDYSAMYLRA